MKQITQQQINQIWAECEEKEKNDDLHDAFDNYETNLQKLGYSPMSDEYWVIKILVHKLQSLGELIYPYGPLRDEIRLDHECVYDLANEWEAYSVPTLYLKLNTPKEFYDEHNFIEPVKLTLKEIKEIWTQCEEKYPNTDYRDTSVYRMYDEELKKKGYTTVESYDPSTQEDLIDLIILKLKDMGEGGHVFDDPSTKNGDIGYVIPKEWENSCEKYDTEMINTYLLATKNKIEMQKMNSCI